MLVLPKSKGACFLSTGYDERSSPYSRCKASSSAPCTISGSESGSSSSSSGSNNNLDSTQDPPSLRHRHHHREDATLMTDLEKDQRLGYLHNYESAYAPKFQNDDFLELEYDRQQPGYDPEHYMQPTAEEPRSMFNPQFLPNFNDMIRLVAQRHDQVNGFYPNESDEYQEIVGSAGAEPEQPPAATAAARFLNRSNFELNRVERCVDYGTPNTQTIGRRSHHHHKPNKFLS